MMTVTAQGGRVPRTILLATDLGSRCDRAFDRAVQLATQFGAQLHVVHALGTAPVRGDARSAPDAPAWRRPPDRVAAARAHLRADLADVVPETAIHVEEGDTLDVVLDVAARTGSDLIVTGVARDEPFGRNLLGDTVDGLMRRAAASLLIVRGRVRRPFAKIAVATDFSPRSGVALVTALELFPAAEFILFTGYRTPFGVLLDREDVRDQLRRMEGAACEHFLDQLAIDPGVRSRIRRVVEQGPPATLLRDYARAEGVDLIVVGTHGGGALHEILVGSTARKIIDAAPVDVLLARSGEAG